MAQPAATLVGHCLCGAVAFELTLPLGPTTHCHCRSCRLSRGTAFVTWTSVPPERFRVSRGAEEITWHRTSPPVRWGFCRNCGSHMLYVADLPGQPDGPTVGDVYVSVGSLDGAADLRPTAHVSFEEHAPWIEGAERLPRYRGKTEERMG
ncbi:MAG TPA: GFA family protein [Caulobacteraceae bacterium]|nr:GFA family protein [Caulobacteraceae bacterium]